MFEYEIIGNLDSDVAFDKDHFEFLLNKFKEDPRLGVAGTVFREEGGYSSETNSFEGQNHVSGQCQVFRRQCFEEIGGYFANKAGGIDWIAVTTARMMGWKTRSYREKSFFHFGIWARPSAAFWPRHFPTVKRITTSAGHPVWELFRVIYRLSQAAPISSMESRLGSGYGWAMVRRVKRPISKRAHGVPPQRADAKVIGHAEVCS